MEMWNLPDEERIAAAQARLLVERCQHLHRTAPINVPPELLARRAA